MVSDQHTNWLQYIPRTFNICLASSNVIPALTLAAACAAPARPPPALRAASWLAAYSCLRALVNAFPTICEPMMIICTIYLAMVWTSSGPGYKSAPVWSRYHGNETRLIRRNFLPRPWQQEKWLPKTYSPFRRLTISMVYTTYQLHRKYA